MKTFFALLSLLLLIMCASAANLIDLYPNAIEQYVDMGINVPPTEQDFIGSVSTNLIFPGGLSNEVIGSVSVMKMNTGKSKHPMYSCYSGREKINTKDLIVAYSWYVSKVSKNLAEWETYIVSLPVDYHINKIRSDRGLFAITEYEPLTGKAMERASVLAGSNSSANLTIKDLSCSSCAELTGFAINNKSMVDEWARSSCEVLLSEKNFTKMGTGIARLENFSVYVQLFTD